MAASKKTTKAKEDTAVEEMRKRFRTATEATETLFDQARSDIKFVDVPGNQWDETLRKKRKNRGCWEFPKLRGQVVGVINEQKQTRPQGKVRGIGSEDRGLAELMQGICRNIESVSNAAQAYDIAYDVAVKGGYGVWRVTTDYNNPDDFDLDIFIKPIRNPFSAKCDPAAVEIDRRDARYWFIEELVAKEEFERKYPDCDITDFFEDKTCANWRDKGQVRVAEYWYKKTEKRELWALSSGAIVYADEATVTEAELLQAGVKVVKRRFVETPKVYMRLTNGREWLTDEVEFPCKFIPIVVVWGNIQNIDGEDYFSGMVRFAKDQQRFHNLHRSAAAEQVAKAPKAPYLLKASWIAGYEDFWLNSNVEDYPYLPVADETPDHVFPQRTQPAEIPSALIALGNMDAEDMKSATGQFAANIGAPSNETSGKAIGMRRAQGAVSTFNYIDNLTYAIQYTYEILVDMIPKVYDTPRVVRILGADGGEKWKQLYQTQVQDPETGEMVEVTDAAGNPAKLNDISKGKYDVTVTVGPSYATQRMEAVEMYTELATRVGASVPDLAPLLVYKAIANMDMPGSEEVDESFRKKLVAMGALPPKEGEEAPAPPPPDPRVEAMVKKLLAEASKSEATAAKTTAEAQTILPQANADITLTVAEAVAQQLQNMAQSGQLAMLMQGQAPPPQPQIPNQQQAPQGAFLLGGDPTAQMG